MHDMDRLVRKAQRGDVAAYGVLAEAFRPQPWHTLIHYWVTITWRRIRCRMH